MASNYKGVEDQVRLRNKLFTNEGAMIQNTIESNLYFRPPWLDNEEDDPLEIKMLVAEKEKGADLEQFIRRTTLCSLLFYNEGMRGIRNFPFPVKFIRFKASSETELPDKPLSRKFLKNIFERMD